MKQEDLITVAYPPEASPVFSTIDPLVPKPPWDWPVLSVSVPLEPSFSPDGALAITSDKRKGVYSNQKR